MVVCGIKWKYEGPFQALEIKKTKIIEMITFGQDIV
jgi:hypothetical protein